MFHTPFHSSTGGGNAPRNVAMSHERQEDCKLLKGDVNDAEFKILVILVKILQPEEYTQCVW